MTLDRMAERFERDDDAQAANARALKSWGWPRDQGTEQLLELRQRDPAAWAALPAETRFAALAYETGRTTDEGR